MSEFRSLIGQKVQIYESETQSADPSDRAVKGVGLRPLACWDWVFESHRGHGCLSVCCECCVLSGRGLGEGPIHRLRDASRMFVIDHDQAR